MKIAVVYKSTTGHSKKIAQAIAKELQTDAIDVKIKPKLDNIDLLFLAGGIYAGSGSKELIEFAKSLDVSKVKKAAIITSSANGTKKQNELRAALLACGIDTIETEYTCKGSFLLISMGHPKTADIAGAVAFAKQTIGSQ